MWRGEEIYVEIVERLRTYVDTRNLGIVVMEGPVELSEDIERFTVDGQIKPAIIMEDYDEIDGPFRSKGITGPRDDMSTLLFQFVLVTPEFRWLMRMKDVLRDCLIGFQPNNAGVLVNEGTRTGPPVGTPTTPIRYVTTVGMSLTVGTTVVPSG